MFSVPKTAVSLALGLGISAMAMPALAQDMMDTSTMTCADFMAMDSAGQMDAVNAAHMADQMAMEGDGMSDEASEGGNMMSEDTVMAVTSACDGHPDMMLSDAMPSGDM